MRLVDYFVKFIHVSLLSFVLLLPTFSYADEVAMPLPLPAGAVQVTPEEFKELKKEEVSKPTSTVPSGSFNFSGGGGGDGAIVIFAIVGTIILIAWVPYVAVLLYRGFKHPEEYKYRSLVNIQYNRLFKSTSIHREGYLTSIKYTPMFSDNPLSQDRETSKTKNYGLNIEIGKYHFNDYDESTNVKQDYDSYYWALGPSFIFGNLKNIHHSLFSKFDLLAGTSFKSDVKLILRADISLNYVVKDGLFFGVGIGGSYLNGQKGKGIISHSSDLSQQWFLNFGVLF